MSSMDTIPSNSSAEQGSSSSPDESDDNYYDDDSDGTSKTLDVSITILSLHGIIAQNSKKTKYNNPNNEHANNGMARDNNTPRRTAFIDQSRVEVVASLAPQDDSGNKVEEEEEDVSVHSVPIQLNSAAASFRTAASSDSSSSVKSTVQNNLIASEIVNWPSTEASSSNNLNFNSRSSNINDLEGNNAIEISTLKFRQKFVCDTTIARTTTLVNNNLQRFVPQNCPINLSIARNGKMALFGTVNVIISGDEQHEKLIRNVQRVESTEEDAKKQKSVCTTIKRKLGNGNSDNNSIPMVRITGDSYQFGIAEDATLRMLISVSDPKEKIGGRNSKRGGHPGDAADDFRRNKTTTLLRPDKAGGSFSMQQRKTAMQLQRQKAKAMAAQQQLTSFDNDRIMRKKKMLQMDLASDSPKKLSKLNDHKGVMSPLVEEGNEVELPLSTKEERSTSPKKVVDPLFPSHNSRPTFVPPKPSSEAVDIESKKNERLQKIMEKQRLKQKNNHSKKDDNTGRSEMGRIVIFLAQNIGKTLISLVLMMSLLYLPIERDVLVSLGRGLLTFIMFMACVAFMVLVNMIVDKL